MALSSADTLDLIASQDVISNPFGINILLFRVAIPNERVIYNLGSIATGVKGSPCHSTKTSIEYAATS
jgi:hypothetical protein